MQRDPLVGPPSAARIRRLVASLVPLALALGLTFAGCAESPPLACPPASAEDCPSLDGVTSFCVWSDWGCAAEPSCGGYFVLRDEGIDARLTYYYAAASDAFVATVTEARGGGRAQCLAGPTSFQVPSGCATDTVAECGPPSRSGDAGIALDARADAPFVATSPSGSPSSQPFAVPPGGPAFERERHAPRGPVYSPR